jgi:membrane protein
MAPTRRADVRPAGPATRRRVEHDADSPHRIPPREWLTILRRAGTHVLSDRLQVASAGIAFFAVLSVAPVLVTALSVYGALNTPEQAIAQLSRATEVLPDDLARMTSDQLVSITEASTRVLTVRGLTGLVVALWTATTAATFLVDALTHAYHETETRGFLRRTGLAVLVVLGGALVLGATVTAGNLVDRVTAGAPATVRVAVDVLSWPVLALLMVAVLAVLYRFAPDRREARWRWISGGAVFATVLWMLVSFAFLAYAGTLGSYEATYGSLAGVAISMFWVWVTVFLVILGAAVNGEAERQTARDSTVGPDRPLGQRGAVVADSAPPYDGDR